MQRLRLKADGRIVELRDGCEAPLAPALAATTFRPDTATTATATATATALAGVRDLRLRSRLTQAEFAAKLGVPIETIRNWEQGKRSPRGPARALLAVIAHAPDTVFAALEHNPEKHALKVFLGPRPEGSCSIKKIKRDCDSI